MGIEELVLFIFLALIAEITGTISGFGSSVFFVPIASLFFDFHSVLGITALFHVSSNISKIYFFRKGIDWKIVLYLGVPSVLFVSLGAYISQFYKSQFLESLLGIFLVGFSILFLLIKKLKIKPNNTNCIVGGGISGFAAGLIGTGGAIRGMTLIVFNLSKEAFISTSALIDFGVDFSRSIIYYFNGYVHWHDLKFVIILLVISFVGTYIGKLLLQRISEVNFKRIVLFALLGIGVFTLISQFMGK